MRVLFVVPSTGYYTRGLSNPLGVLSIATYLKSFGHHVSIYDRNIDKTKMDKKIQAFNPDIVGVSVMSARCLKDALRVSKIAKKYQKILVWGGQMPTMNLDICFKSEHVDYIIYGEGESTWLEFVQKIENAESSHDIDGIAYKKDGKIEITRYRDFVDLKDIPNIDWSLVNPKDYFQKFFHSDRMLWLYSSKGCPFDCGFCGNRIYHQCKRRKRPVDRVIEEIVFLVENHAMNAVFFADELWVITEEEALEFCEKIKRTNKNFVWGCQLRIGQFSKQTIQAMYDANCRWILYGIESGSEQVLKTINKKIKVADVEESINNSVEIGITPVASFIIGFPDENESQLKETIDLIMRIKARIITVYHFYPTPGSRMQESLEERGLYSSPKTVAECIKAVATEHLGTNYSNVPAKDLRVIKCFFHWLAFTGKDTVNKGNSFEFAKKAISDMLLYITKKGIIHFLRGSFEAAKEFLYVFFHVMVYRGVRKKYGLYRHRKN